MNATRAPLFSFATTDADHQVDDHAGDWWVVPVGGGTTRWCPACAEGHVEELLDAGAWTVEAESLDGDERCEPCGRRP